MESHITDILTGIEIAKDPKISLTISIAIKYRQSGFSFAIILMSYEGLGSERPDEFLKYSPQPKVDTF